MQVGEYVTSAVERQGIYGVCEEVYERMLEMETRHFGAESRQAANQLLNSGRLLAMMGRYE